MFQLKTSSTQLVTRALASTFATMTPSPTERAFSEKRATYLQDRYDRGMFIPCQWASVWLGGSQFRMNGQHSSSILAKLPEPFPTHLYAHMDEYEAETPEDMTLLFRQFDPRESSRSARDVSGAYQYTYPELRSLHPDVVKLGAEGIAWYLRVIVGSNIDRGDDRYQLLGKPLYYDFLRWLGGLLDMKTPELKKIEIIAAMYATDIVAESASREFWEKVARGGNAYDEQDPTTVLDKWLKSCRDGTCDDKMKQSYHYQGCIYAWNAMRDEQRIRSIKFTTSKGLYVPHD